MNLLQNQFQDLKSIQEKVLHFIDNDNNAQKDDVKVTLEDIQSIINTSFQNDSHKLELFLHFILIICENHHQTPNFQEKINQILQPIRNEKYQQLINEISDHIKSPTNENDEKLEAKVIKIILNDSINDLFSLLENSTFSIDSQINYKHTSLQPVHKKTNCSLIEFAALCGSIQIFKYLLTKKAKINLHNLWLFSIHGRNNEIIHLIEENSESVNKNEKDFISLTKESIHCIHNEIADYIFNNYIQSKTNEIYYELLNESIQSYNFQYITEILEKYPNLNMSSLLLLFCLDGYQSIVEFLCNQQNIDVNVKNENFKFSFINKTFLFRL